MGKCKKLLNLPQGKRKLVVSVLNRLRNKELLAVSGQEIVVLAAEVKKLGKLIVFTVELISQNCFSFFVKSFMWFIFVQ